MNTKTDALCVYQLEGGKVGISHGLDGVIVVLEPRVAVEVAQSLTLAAMDADPSMDVEQVVEDYLAAINTAAPNPTVN